MLDAAVTPRTTIFISHATPEDNVFTRWLAGQLTLAGYDVWFDLDYLKGGDYFWTKVESVIRNQAIRVIAVVSNNSYNKSGVRNEWDLALTLERDIPGYLIPVRLDDFAFSSLPITIHRKNVIDFHAGWHIGLKALLVTLSDAGIPTVNESDPSSAKAWLFTPEEPITHTSKSETLDSNWLPILTLPAALETLEICSSLRQIPITAENSKFPWFELGDHIVCFAPKASMIESFASTAPLRFLAAIDTESFISQGSGWKSQRVEPFDARNRVAFLIKQAWDNAMVKAGLLSYELANKKTVWYLPDGLISKNKVAFQESGKTRRKQLVGSSDKYRVKWHFGVTMHPALTEPKRLELRAHIIFTESDGKPLESQARMHRLRRSFCKNWWNDRWRGFMQGFVTFISGNGQNITLPVGGDRTITVSSQFISLTAPIGLSDSTELIEDEDIEIDSDLDGDLDVNDFDAEEYPDEEP